MHTLWLSWLETGQAAHRDAVLLSLRQMLNGGIYDHVGGGLCRYSTDAEWLVPHFEKMLYDNAMLIRLANWAFAETGDATVSRPNRNHRRLAAARNARRRRRLRRQPGRRQRRRGGVVLHVGPIRDRIGAWQTMRQHSSPLTRWQRRMAGKASRSSAATPAATECWQSSPCWQSCSRFASKRVRPGRDDKVLADWNGLAIAALAEAARSLQPPRLAGRRARPPIVSSPNQRAGDGRLPHSILGDRRLFPAMSSDYAAMANAAIALYEATGRRRPTSPMRSLTSQHSTAGTSTRRMPATISPPRTARRPDSHPRRRRRSDTVGDQPDHRGLRPHRNGDGADRSARPRLGDRQGRNWPHPQPGLWPGRHRQCLHDSRGKPQACPGR